MYIIVQYQHVPPRAYPLAIKRGLLSRLPIPFSQYLSVVDIVTITNTNTTTTTIIIFSTTTIISSSLSSHHLIVIIIIVIVVVVIIIPACMHACLPVFRDE
jgi:hypothetical protein